MNSPGSTKCKESYHASAPDIATDGEGARRITQVEVSGASSEIAADQLSGKPHPRGGGQRVYEQDITSNTLLKRLGRSEEIARVILCGGWTAH